MDAQNETKDHVSFRSSSESYQESKTVPTQMQVVVQVGTRWGASVPLNGGGGNQKEGLKHENNITNKSIFCRDVSNSCPNLAIKTTTAHCNIYKKQPLGECWKDKFCHSGIYHPYMNRIFPHNIDNKIPLSWSANFCGQKQSDFNLYYQSLNEEAKSILESKLIPLKHSDSFLLFSKHPNLFVRQNTTNLDKSKNDDSKNPLRRLSISDSSFPLCTNNDILSVKDNISNNGTGGNKGTSASGRSNSMNLNKYTDLHSSSNTITNNVIPNKMSKQVNIGRVSEDLHYRKWANTNIQPITSNSTTNKNVNEQNDFNNKTLNKSIMKTFSNNLLSPILFSNDHSIEDTKGEILISYTNTENDLASTESCSKPYVQLKKENFDKSSRNHNFKYKSDKEEEIPLNKKTVRMDSKVPENSTLHQQDGQTNTFFQEGSCGDSTLMAGCKTETGIVDSSTTKGTVSLPISLLNMTLDNKLFYDNNSNQLARKYDVKYAQDKSNEPDNQKVTSNETFLDKTKDDQCKNTVLPSSQVMLPSSQKVNKSNSNTSKNKPNEKMRFNLFNGKSKKKNTMINENDTHDEIKIGAVQTSNKPNNNHIITKEHASNKNDIYGKFRNNMKPKAKVKYKLDKDVGSKVINPIQFTATTLNDQHSKDNSIPISCCMIDFKPTLKPSHCHSAPILHHQNEETSQEIQLMSYSINEDIAWIMDHLYLGSIEAAYCEPVLCRLNIQYVVDISNLRPSQIPANKKSICPCTCSQVTAHPRTRLCINIPDCSTIELSTYTEDVNTFINAARKLKKNVLVHCYNGNSRGPAMVLQYIMQVHGFSLNKAYKQIQAVRPNLNINPGFYKSLRKLERHLLPLKASKSTDNAAPKTGFPPKTKRAWN